MGTTLTSRRIILPPAVQVIAPAPRAERDGDRGLAHNQ